MKNLKNYQEDFDEIEIGKFSYIGRNEININKLRVQCNRCGNIFELSFQMMKKNGFKCPRCEITHHCEKKDFETYWKEFKEAGLDDKYEIDENEYTSSNGKIHGKCKKCGVVRYSRARSFIDNPNCSNCFNSEKAYSEEYVKQTIKEKYGGNIEVVEFNGCQNIRKVKCNRCGKTTQKIIGPLLKESNKSGCRYCRLTMQIGKLHPSWTGGTQSISDYFRSAVYRTWREDSLKFYGENCLISNSNDNIVIHHLNKSFLDIQNQVFEEYNYTKETIVENIKKKI